MSTKEEIEERRRARAAVVEKAKEAQAVKDLEALDALEEKHGYGAIRGIDVGGYKEGLPTRAFLKKPTRPVYQRFVDKVQRAIVGGEKRNPKAMRDAQDELAKSCWVYPEDEDTKAAMLEEWPGLLASIATAASKLAEGAAEEEGKD